MLWTIYFVVLIIIFVSVMIWLYIHVNQANKRWDNAYILRYRQLQKTLPPSDTFPAMLIDTQLGISRFSSLRDKYGILYIHNNNLILETVGSQKAAPYYQVYPMVHSPIREVFLKADGPETTIPNKGSYVLFSHDTKQNARYPYLIGEMCSTPADIKLDNDILKWRHNIAGQHKIISALKAAGIAETD